MKNITTIFLFTALVGLSGLCGCKKLIDVGSPQNTITTTEVFNNSADANSAVIALYSQLMTNSGNEVFSNGGLTLYAGMSSDEFTTSQGTLDLTGYPYYTNTLLSSDQVVLNSMWTPAYQIIYGANATLAGIAASTSPALTDSARTQLNGECKFIRAFCYFYLTNLFGDVPLVLSTNFNQTDEMARTSQTAVYAQIIQDLKDAQSDLKSDYSASNGERIRANTWAATALLARVYLYTGDWADAEAQATAVIGNSQFSLCPSLTSVFLKNSTEAILQWQQNAIYQPNAGTWDGKNFLPLVSWHLFFPSAQAVNQLSPATFASLGVLLMPAHYFDPSYMTVFEAGDLRVTQWMDSLPTPSAAPYNGVTYYFPGKYTVYSSSTNGPINQYYMVLRLAEQYLIRAEARAQEGTNLSGAAADLNVIRTRAGLPNTTASTAAGLVSAVGDERQRELFGEWGHRWFDLKRTGQANAVLGGLSWKQPWSANSLLYPIPISEMTNDHNLVQNPGYQ